MDCFAALAMTFLRPSDRSPPSSPGLTGRSSTPRPIGFNHCRLWNAGSPACAGDDDGVCVCILAARFRPSFSINLHALQSRGRRECRAPAGTRGLVCKQCRRYAHEHTGTAGAARHSLRDGFTAYTVLSLETNSFCLHRRRIEGPADPVGSAKTSAGLTPATGARTTRLYFGIR